MDVFYQVVSGSAFPGGGYSIWYRSHSWKKVKKALGILSKQFKYREYEITTVIR